MPLITTPERVGHCRGLRRAIELLLKGRFGEEGLKLMPEIREIDDDEKLEAILTAVGTANNLDELRRLWSARTP